MIPTDTSYSRTPEASTPIRADEGLDVAQMWGALRDGRGVILRIALGLFVLAALFTFGSRMAFKSRGRMYLGELDGKPSAATGELDLSSADQSGVASETEILQSDSLITRAIMASGLNVVITPAGWRAPRYYQWLLGKGNPDMVDVAVAEIGATNAQLESNYRGEQAYRAVFTTGTEYELWSSGSHFGPWSEDSRLLGRGKLGEPAKLRGLALTLTPGTQRAPRAGAAYDIKVAPLDAVVADVTKVLTVVFPKPVGQGETTKVVALEFTHASPHLAASFLQHLMRSYLEAHQSWKVEDATAAEAFVSSQLVVIREALDKTEKKLAEYRSNTRSVVLDNEASAMIEQVGKYEEQRIAARLQVAALTDMKQALKDPNARMEAFLMGEGDDAVLQNLATTLSKARQDLASLEQKFNPAAPDVRQQRAQVDAQLEMIRNYLTSRLTRAQASLASLGQVVSQYEEKLKTVPSAELGLAQLARESEVYSKIYSYLLERQQQTAIIKASRVSKNRVLDAPDVPYRADSPRLRTLILGALLGLFFGCAFVLLRRLFSPFLQSQAEVASSSGALPILAGVPWRSPAESRKSKAAPSFEALATDRNSDFAEAFRILRTNLYYARSRELAEAGRDGGQVLLVTSPTRSDGKTTTVFALAAMLAADNKTVLIVDSDLRKPGHHTLMRQPQTPGLSGVLAGHHEWFDAVRSPVPGLHTMAAGLASSSDLLSSETLAAMLKDARSVFDFVLLDVPSFPLVSDALILGEHVDYVLSVVRLRNTPRRLAAEHIERLSSLACGYSIVVNDVGVSVSHAPTEPRPQKGSQPSGAAGQAPRVARS